MRGLLRYAADAVRSGIEGGKQAKADKLKLGILAQDRGRKEQDRQRDIEQDMLQKSILEFNYGQAQERPKQQAAAAQREATELAALRGQSPEFANLSREAIERQLGERAKPKVAEKVPLITGPGNVRIPDVAGAHVKEESRPASAAEVAAQDQLPIVEESYHTLEDIESRDPRIGNRVIAKANKARQLSISKGIAGLYGKMTGTRSEEDQKQLTEEAIINSLSPEEARWYAAQKGYLSGVLPALGGKSLTYNEVVTHGGPMFSTGEESDESLAQKKRARAARYQATRHRAGAKDEAPRVAPPQPSATARALVSRVK